jgi:uncharacterized protein (DUF924 family)
MSEHTAAEVTAFWRDAGSDRWWRRDDEFDRLIRSKFLPLHEAAARGELAQWEDSPEGALALVILLDQFPRNMFRGSPHAFATDPLARGVASRGITRGFDRKVDPVLRQFFYLPFMHSELLADQDHCCELFEVLGDSDLTKFAYDHRDIIARFGRFPHRNRALERTMTSAEQDFLDAGGFAG